MNSHNTIEPYVGTLTVCEIKDYLQIGANSAYNLIHSKAFPVIRIGHSYRIPKDGFYEWLKHTHAIDLMGVR